MSIFHTIRQTFYNENFYKEVALESTGKSIKYYFKLSLLLALLGMLVGSLIIIPLLSKFLGEFKAEILSSYPESLEVSIDNGVASSNALNQPFIIPMKESWKEKAQNMEENKRKGGVQDLENLITIHTDSVATPTIEEFKALDSYALLTKDYFVHYDRNNAVVFQELKEVPSFTLNKANLEKWLGYTKYIAYVVPPAVFLVVFFSAFGNLLFLILIALIFFVLQKLMSKQMTYGASYRVCVYASTGALLLTFLLLVFGANIPFLFTFITLLIAIINTKNHEPLGTTSSGSAVPTIPPGNA